ncbi:hypothetical protein ACFQ51_26470 [Streptomyces kaempferi]
MSSFESTVPGELGDPAVGTAEVPEPGAVTIVVPTFNEAATSPNCCAGSPSRYRPGCPARWSSWTTPPTTPPA